MKIKIVYLVVLISIVAFCQNIDSSFSKEETGLFNKEFLGDSVYNILVPKNDHRIKTKDGYKNISDDDLILKSNNYIILNSSCGTSCYYTIFLEIKKGAIGKKYFYCFAYNLAENLVAYVSEADYKSIIIENFKNSKKYFLKITDVCSSAVPYSCIEKAYFLGKQLILQYNGENWPGKYDDLHTIKISTDLD